MNHNKAIGMVAILIAIYICVGGLGDALAESGVGIDGNAQARVGFRVVIPEILSLKTSGGLSANFGASVRNGSMVSITDTEDATLVSMVKTAGNGSLSYNPRNTSEDGEVVYTLSSP